MGQGELNNMVKEEKRAYVMDNHFSEWVKVRQVVEQEVSDKYSMFCVCRRLCTGLHEQSCGKFRAEVDRETMNRLSHLLPAKK